MDTQSSAQQLQQQAQLQQQMSNNNNNNSVLHVRGDSESQLELLFSVLKSNEQQQSNQTFRNKILPPSFFNPPKPKPCGHTPEGSIDGSYAGPQGMAPQVSGAIHSRSHSSPAPLTFSVAPPPGQAPPVSQVVPHHHAKQGSMDGLIDGRMNQQRQVQTHHQHQGSWPSNQIVTSYINGVESTTGGGIWSACPAKTSSGGNSLGKPPKCSSAAAKPPICTNNNNAADPLGPLPPGWDRGVTPEGDVYFINHIDKTTSWHDPRIPKHLQKATPAKLAGKSMYCNQPAASASKQQLQYQQQLLNAGQQQLMSPSATGQQQQVTQASMNETFIRAELLKLHKEKERLRMEQEENKRREQMLLNQLRGAGAAGGTAGFTPVGGTVPPGITGLVDPFLGPAMGPSVVGALHARQSSGDSGQVGSLGTGFSLPRHSADFMDNMSSIDMQDVKPMTGMDFKCGSDGTLGLGDMPSFIDSSSEPVMSMDSDDLVSSLNEDITRDLLNMDPQTMESLLWL